MVFYNALTKKGGVFIPDIKQQIREQNPWWQSASEIHVDHHITQFDESPLDWDPPVLEQIQKEPGNIQTLRGPRQVGKTTSVKRTIRALLNEGHKRVLYFACDLLNDPEDLSDLINSARNIHPDPDGPWYIFLDEVTSIEDWQSGIKYEADRGSFQDDFVLLTGSSASDLREGAELLPGRRGHGNDLLMLPMSFHNFANQFSEVELPTERISHCQMFSNDGERAFKEWNLHSETLNQLLHTYLQIGGFPQAVSDFIESEEISEETIRIWWNTIAGDVSKARKNRDVAMKLLEEVSRSLASTFVWNKIGNHLDIHPQTVKDYTRLLAESFMLMTVYFWDLGGKTLRPSKARKAYFLDPLIARIPPTVQPGSRVPGEDALIENSVAIGLFRSTANVLMQSDPVPGGVHTWRSTSNREIDFLIPGDKMTPVEVKGNNSTRIANARKAITNRFNEGVIVTRTNFDWDKTVPTIPVGVFLAALEEQSSRDKSLSVES